MAPLFPARLLVPLLVLLLASPLGLASVHAVEVAAPTVDGITWPFKYRVRGTKKPKTDHRVEGADIVIVWKRRRYRVTQDSLFIGREHIYTLKDDEIFVFYDRGVTIERVKEDERR